MTQPRSPHRHQKTETFSKMPKTIEVEIDAAGRLRPLAPLPRLPVRGLLVLPEEESPASPTRGRTAADALKLLAVDARRLAPLSLADPVTAVTGRPAAFLLVVTAFYGLAWWFRDDAFAVPGRDEDWDLSRPYVLTATALTVVGLGLDLSGFGLSVAWAAFGAALFGAGLGTDSRPFRLQGVVVFGVTTAKVFLFDTQGLDTVARTISFLVLGAILLAASYAYARWQGDRPLDRLTEL